MIVVLVHFLSEVLQASVLLSDRTVVEAEVNFACFGEGEAR